MRTILLLIALLWPNTEKLQYPVYNNQSNIQITYEYLNIKSVLGFKGHEWTVINKDTLKVGVNEFYYVLESNLAVELKIYKYVP